MSDLRLAVDIIKALYNLHFCVTEAAHIISDIAKAIHFLHSMNIAHRDLKVRFLVFVMITCMKYILASSFGFQTRSDTDQDVQLQKIARGLKSRERS